jgi:curved DNA-binding protein CbpA
MAQNYYEALNITSTATREEIHNAYRELARRYHPDRNNDAGAAQIMAVINEAYAVLNEPDKRSRYDRELQSPAGSVDDVILAAARDVLCGRGWTLTDDQFHAFTLRQSGRHVFVALVPVLTAAALSRYAARCDGFGAILTLRAEEDAVKRRTPLLVVDVMRSRLVAGSFPDAVYEDLFRPLC